MAPALTPAQVAIVKSTAPALKEHGVDITALFYSNMLKAHPELNDIFSEVSQTTRRQPRALAASVVAYATYIDDLGKLGPAVERIAHKHASVHVEPAHYDVVAKYLTNAIIQVVGADVLTGALYDAWIAAYWNLAYVFIDREHALYKEAGWVGWRDFVVEKKVQESDEVTSFYLRPKDGKALPPYRPGQYISVQRFVPQLGVTQNRQYVVPSSLSV